MVETKEEPTLRTDVWDRWGWIWSAVFYISLLVAFLLAWPDLDFSRPDGILVLVLTLASALWHPVGAWYLPRRYPNFRERPVLMVMYLLVAFALWLALISIHGAFYFLLFGLYGQVFAFLPIRLSIPAAILLSTFVMVQQIRDSRLSLSPNEPAFWIFAGATLGGVLIALWLNAIISQSAHRKQLVEQLEATQRELAQAEREAGILAERQRLGREIHDTLAQGFTSIVMHLEAAEQACPPEATVSAHHVNEARKVARESLAEARGLVWSLRPTQLQENTLPEAIERVVRQWSSSTGIQAETLVTGDALALHPQAEVAFLRTVQEGLANVQKHASASAVTVTLSYLSNVVLLDVQDNGVGFDVDRVSDSRPGLDGGYGLPAMQERVTQLGGMMTIESGVGEGTTLALEIPV
jgi:signal transduction histidine kinase